MVESRDNAGVRLPPPALYALAVLGGYALNRRWPLPMANGIAIDAVAAALTVVSVVLAASSIGNFHRSRTSIVPIRPASALVISGPYRFTRNPMYVSMALLTVALGLFMNNWWPILLLLPVLLVVRVFVIAPEERYLKRRFGAEYVGYMKRVRRWV